jgi:hypothetical protein
VRVSLEDRMKAIASARRNSEEQIRKVIGGTKA